MELHLESGHCSDQGRRDTMEDTHKVVEGYQSSAGRVAFYGVYDGHGGKDTADLLEKHLHENIFKTESFKNGQIKEAIIEGFEQTDKFIVDQCNQKGWSNGSTAVVCIIHNNTLYVANVGDSEAVLVKQNQDRQWEAEALTVSHKASDPEEKKRIEGLGGHVFFGRVFGALAVARSFGDSKFKEPKTSKNFVSWEPAIKIVPLTPEHKFLILACDGLWDVMNYREVAEFVVREKEEGKTVKEISEKLVKEALNKRTEDNVTVIVIRFDWKDKDRNVNQNASVKTTITGSNPVTNATTSPSETTSTATNTNTNSTDNNNTNNQKRNSSKLSEEAPHSTTSPKLFERGPLSSASPRPVSDQINTEIKTSEDLTTEKTDAKPETNPKSTKQVDESHQNVTKVKETKPLAQSQSQHSQ